MPGSRTLRLADVPAGVDEPRGGGAAFFAYCVAAGTRARVRRESLNRSWAEHRRAVTRSARPYPTALVLCQRAGVALEDLGRLTLALDTLETDDPFETLRAARIDDLDDAFERLRDAPEQFRKAIRLPTPEDTADIDDDLRAALLEASDRLASRWHQHWSSCAGGWLLLRHIAKAMRHGLPLIPRELVIDSPGAGALGRGTEDLFDAWVLIVRTDVDQTTRALNTSWSVADLELDTLSRARQTGLDAIALARELGSAHAHRVRSASRWALPDDVVRLVSPAAAHVLRKNARG